MINRLNSFPPIQVRVIYSKNRQFQIGTDEINSLTRQLLLIKLGYFTHDSSQVLQCFQFDCFAGPFSLKAVFQANRWFH